MNLIITFFLTTGIVINAIILLLLIKSKTKETPQQLLLLFFSITLFYIIHGYAQVHKLKFLFLSTFVFNEIIEFFTGPLIFVYIKSLFEGKTKTNKEILHSFCSHFALFAMCVHSFFDLNH